MKKPYLVLLLFCFYSCTNTVKFKLLKEMHIDSCIFLTEDSLKINSILIISDFDHLALVDNCLGKIELKRSSLNQLLENNDLIISPFRIDRILEESSYTSLDQCPEWLKIIDVKLHSEKQTEEKVYVYGIKPKGKYRINLCP